jgi:hypothetical protein
MNPSFTRSAKICRLVFGLTFLFWCELSWCEVPVSQLANLYAAIPASDEADFSIDLPTCKRDLKAWQKFSPLAEASTKADRTSLAASRAAFLREAAQDIIWVDLNADGWCDIVTSVQKQRFTIQQNGKPLLLPEANCTLQYDPREKVFHYFPDSSRACISGELANGNRQGRKQWSSSAYYLNKRTKEVERVTRDYMSNSIQATSAGAIVFHSRMMLRQLIRELERCNKTAPTKKCGDVIYKNEVEPLFDFVLSPETARAIQDKEARRNGGGYRRACGAPATNNAN